MLPFDPSIQYPTSHCFLRDMHEMMKLGKRRTASFDGRGEESDKSVVLITYKRELDESMTLRLSVESFALATAYRSSTQSRM